MNKQTVQEIPASRYRWLWLLVGFVLLPFSVVQTVIPLAAWLAPVFLLRFMRTSPRARSALPLVFLAYVLGLVIATRGSDPGSLPVLIYGLIVGPVIRSLMYTLPYGADRLAGSRLASGLRALVFPLAFTTAEWLMSLSAATNTSGSPAASQYGNLALIQILSITGMWGLTFLITWFASTVNELWEHAFDWRPVRGALAAFAAALLAVLAYGGARLAFFPPAAPAVQAATITLDDALSQQANRGIDWLTFNQSTDAQRAAVRPQFQATVDQLLARTETALRAGARIVAWQEGAGTVLEEDKQSVLDRAAALARTYDAYLEISLGVATRTPDRHYILNESILVDSTGAVRWTYDKTYPVMPVESYVFRAGSGQLPLAQTPYGLLSTAICNDLHFPSLLRQAGAKDVDILIAPYNDFHPWEQDDEVTAVYRAVENGFSVLRPAGHGYATIIDYQGRVLARQDYFTNASGIMLDGIPTGGAVTVYSRIGDLFAYLCAVGLLGLAAWAFLRRNRPASDAWIGEIVRSDLGIE